MSNNTAKSLGSVVKVINALDDESRSIISEIFSIFVPIIDHMNNNSEEKITITDETGTRD